MKIAFFIPFLSSKGGAEIYLSNVARELSVNNEVKIYTMRYNKNVFPSITNLVVELGVPWPINLFSKSKASVILNINAIKMINKKIPNNYDIYNFHLFPSNLMKVDGPMIWTAQEPSRMLYDLESETLNELNFLQKGIAKVYFPLLKLTDKFFTERNVNHIIANSVYSKNYLMRLYHKPVDVVYPGVSEKLFKIKNKNQKVILSVSRLYKTKRVDLVINAFNDFLKQKPDYELRIIGNGPEMNSLKQLVNYLGINKKVKFLGQVSDEELLTNYSEASLLLYYPIREMFGIVPLEAIAAGVPVVAVNEGGFHEVVGNIIKSTDTNIKNIVKAMNYVLNNNKQIIKNGRKLIKNYTWRKVAKRTEELFKQLIKQYS